MLGLTFGVWLLEFDMVDYPKFEFHCPQCHEKLTAFTNVTMEIIKRIHIDNHHKIWVGQRKEDYLHLFNGRYEDSDTGEWKEWSDVEFLTRDMKIEVLGEDKRTQDELDKRYKPRDNFAGGMEDDA